jgi:sugar phosphate isomerase/epimerase
MIALDGLLSIEQSRQSWPDFRAVFDVARDELGPDAERLRLCYDPCNLLTPADGVDTAEVTRSLNPDEISMVHAKQRSGRPLPSVADGDIDWSAQAAALRQIGYAGPLLFEIEPDTDIWNNFAISRNYLRDCGFDIVST